MHRHARRPMGRLARRLALVLAASLLPVFATVGNDAGAAARLTATWRLADARAGVLTTSTVTLRPATTLTVASLGFRLPAGVTGTLRAASVSGMSTGTVVVRSGIVTFQLRKPSVLRAGRTATLVLSGWRNPATAGYERISAVTLRTTSRTSVGSGPTEQILVQGAVAATVNASVDAAGGHIAWDLTLPPAPAYTRLTLGVPRELPGTPTVTIDGRPQGIVERRPDAVVYTTPAGSPLPSRTHLTVTATWPVTPRAVRDVPLAVSAGSATTSWALGEYRTPAALQPATCGAYRVQGWLTAENAEAADSGWDAFPSRWTTGAPQGWLDDVSAQCGDDVGLHVSADRRYRVFAYRMGWYGGLGARLVWASGYFPANRQPAAIVTPTTNMVSTAWTRTATIHVGTGWIPGTYLLKLVDTTGAASFVPLTVRDDASTSALLVQNSVLTWQAYNDWGGRSLYVGPGRTPATRSRVVSFDRPYNPADIDHGAGRYLRDEYPFIRYAERNGLDLSYWTDLDLVRHPSYVSNHKALVLLRHSEYWTQGMRDAVTSARDAGVNLVFLGANNVYWRARLEPSPMGDLRREVVYRIVAEDPQPDASTVTTTFRSSPISDPEQRLIGAQYDCLEIDATMTVTDAAQWVFNGSGIGAGTQLPHLIFGEFDRYYDGTGGPPVEVLAHSPLACPAHNEDSTYADMTYYNASSGAGVFDAGTLGWVPALDSYSRVAPFTDAERAAVQQVTLNVLTVFGQGPAADYHPAVPNSVGLGFGASPPPAQPMTTDGDDVELTPSDLYDLFRSGRPALG